MGISDRFTVIHRYPSMSALCLNELPPNTIHSPEGHPVLPRAVYRFLPPFGVECTFTMTDGSSRQTSHPNYFLTVIASLPIALTFTWAVWTLRPASRKWEDKVGYPQRHANPHTGRPARSSRLMLVRGQDAPPESVPQTDYFGLSPFPMR